MAELTPRHDESKPKPIRDRLWWIATAPSVWALHFLACYITAAIWCEKFAGKSEMTTLWWWIGAYTLVALTVIIAIAVASYRNFRRGDPPLPYEFDDPSDRTHFLGFTAFLLAMLSLVATSFTALVFVLVRSCE